MKTIMIHHLSGQGFDPVAGSVDIKALEKIIDNQKYTLTFDDRLQSQELALDMLKRKGIQAYFFVNHHNEMEQDRATRDRLGEGFYAWFFRQFEVMMLPHIVPLTMPDSFLAQYKFYSYEDRLYRYFRDIAYPEIHDIIMKPHREMVELLDLNKLKDHKIGMHSFSHPRRMENLSRDDQFKEYLDNLNYIFETTGQLADSMSHPMGSYNNDTLSVLRELGVLIGYRADKTKGPTTLEYPRIDIQELC